jgi:thiamine-phosphate pyrophosphorylase
VKALPFKLLIITDWSLPDCLERIADALLAGPGIAVQHRHPGATDRQFYEEGRRLKDVCGDAPLFINGRLDLALSLDAHLHLTERALLSADVRPHLGSRWLSSASHPPAAEPTGVDLLLVSPVFQPTSKTDDRTPLGVAAFHDFARATPTPCFALGGITAARLASLGTVAGVAVIGEVMHAASPRHAAQALLRALG